MMIPRVAHVIWVGGAAMPEKETACLERNRDILSAYDLLLWGDDDIGPLTEGLPEVAKFIDFARAERKWAFIADAMKMLILSRFGGWVPTTNFCRHPMPSGVFIGCRASRTGTDCRARSPP